MPAAGAPIALVLPACVAAGVLARVLGVLTGAATLLPEVSIRIRVALAVAFTAVSLPLAVAVQGSTPPATGGPVLLMLAGEAAVGLGLGAALAAVVSAGAWAGGVLGSVAGLSWADDFGPEGAAESAGCARFAWWTSAGVFLAAGGLEAVAVGIIDSLRVFPIGAALSASGTLQPGLDHLAAGMPTVAIALALSLAVPALLAVLAFHVTAAIVLRTVPFTPGAGFLQGLAAMVLLAALFCGADAWARRFPSLVQGPIEHVFAAR